MGFVLFFFLVIAFSAWASKPPKPMRTWKDWLGIGIYGLLALIAFAVYFPTAAAWTLGLAAFFTVVGIPLYGARSLRRSTP